jgi:hypothetical protein
MGRATARSVDAEGLARDVTPDVASAKPAQPRTAFATASHADLFREAMSGPRCDVCNVPLDPKASDEHGTGVYVWVRGGEVRRETVPLCPMCSGAVFASALGFIDYDDEE